MNSDLSNFQIAILQQMGLTVWQANNQDDKQTHGLAVTSEPVPQTSVNAQTRLASLRATLDTPSSTSNRETLTPAHHSPAEQDRPPVITKPAIVPSPLSPEQKHQAKALIDDIEFAVKEYGTKASTLAWYVGQQLSFVDNAVTMLPDVSDITPAMKKSLWQQISQS
jgi:hypothetical protein